MVDRARQGVDGANQPYGSVQEVVEQDEDEGCQAVEAEEGEKAGEDIDDGDEDEDEDNLIRVIRAWSTPLVVLDEGLNNATSEPAIPLAPASKVTPKPIKEETQDSEHIQKEQEEDVAIAKHIACWKTRPEDTPEVEQIPRKPLPARRPRKRSKRNRAKVDLRRQVGVLSLWQRLMEPTNECPERCEFIKRLS